MVLKVYLNGERHGIYWQGDVILARRDEDPFVRKGYYYTISEVLDGEFDACNRPHLLRLEEVEGIYGRRTFRVDDECIRRTNGLGKVCWQEEGF